MTFSLSSSPVAHQFVAICQNYCTLTLYFINRLSSVGFKNIENAISKIFVFYRDVRITDFVLVYILFKFLVTKIPKGVNIYKFNFS